MAVAHRPETIVALRARHEALRIAQAVIRGAGVDVEQLNCHACGTDLDWRNPTGHVATDCPACGAVNELPCHLRYRTAAIPHDVSLDYASIEPDRRVWWNDVIPTAAPAHVHAALPADEPAPGWLKVFCLTCLVAVLAALALIALNTRLF